MNHRTINLTLKSIITSGPNLRLYGTRGDNQYYTINVTGFDLFDLRSIAEWLWTQARSKQNSLNLFVSTLKGED